MTDDDHACFELNGARVHGDPEMSEEARDALRAVLDAALTAFRALPPDPEREARWAAGQERIRARREAREGKT